ncbi:methyltransferase domain-containing protein [Leptolyngbya sp. CCNP1308]|uniref:class I SAM-dependent methyltransferase n=1 Tax=Leptolyngbya sp. CCNP1308 TaxID=3110255 RepID=UPI002B1EFB37|nr:methyltransferase domain-containing protein [Leptolyngbya sp. CCNP1308]MEA5448114.1 methyltransferase domain-containing protein [Leptolyngbya sp. CCNP1308]
MSQTALTPEALHRHRQQAAEASAGISSKTIHTCFERELLHCSASGAVLDWGSGQGLLTQRLLNLEQFQSITAADIQPRPETVDAAIQWIQADLNNPLSLEVETFDVIVSAEVIEHLENPRGTVREWFRLLKPGGLLIFSTPNNESWRAILALILQGHFVDFGDSSYPAHITALVRKDITHILSEAGFCLPKFAFTNVGKIPKLTRHHWQSLSLGYLGGLRFSDNILTVTYKPNKL